MMITIEDEEFREFLSVSEEGRIALHNGFFGLQIDGDTVSVIFANSTEVEVHSKHLCQHYWKKFPAEYAWVKENRPEVLI